MNKFKYKVTYYDPAIWMCESAVKTFDTLKEAEEYKDGMLEEYPPRYHGAYIKIEKIAELFYKKLGVK